MGWKKQWDENFFIKVALLTNLLAGSQQNNAGIIDHSLGGQNLSGIQNWNLNILQGQGYFQGTQPQGVQGQIQNQGQGAFQVGNQGVPYLGNVQGQIQGALQGINQGVPNFGNQGLFQGHFRYV